VHGVPQLGIVERGGGADVSGFAALLLSVPGRGSGKYMYGLRLEGIGQFADETWRVRFWQSAGNDQLVAGGVEVYEGRFL
jgi:hypothetical protein